MSMYASFGLDITRAPLSTQALDCASMFLITIVSCLREASLHGMRLESRHPFLCDILLFHPRKMILWKHRGGCGPTVYRAGTP